MEHFEGEVESLLDAVEVLEVVKQVLGFAERELVTDTLGHPESVVEMLDVRHRVGVRVGVVDIVEVMVSGPVPVPL